MKPYGIRIYRDVPCTGSTIECSRCNVRVLYGTVPKFCAACGTEFSKFLDKSTVQPESERFICNSNRSQSKGQECVIVQNPYMERSMCLIEFGDGRRMAVRFSSLERLKGVEH